MTDLTPETTTSQADRTGWNAALATLRQKKANDAAFAPHWREQWTACYAECKAVPNYDERDEKVKAIRARYDMDLLDEVAGQLTEAVCDAEEVVMALPAPDLAALRTKLDLITANGTEWAGYSEDYTAQLRADIARLLPKEA